MEGDNKKEFNSEELKKELAKCEKQKADFLAGWQRARADFLNYKKEEMERISGLVGYAQAEMILRILPILDNFDLAEKKVLEETKQDENVKGFLQIKNQILDFLKSLGIEAIKSKGEKFDPNFHEAVETIETKDKESNKIIEEIQKGYKLHNKVIRPARVKVTK